MIPTPLHTHTHTHTHTLNHISFIGPSLESGQAPWLTFDPQKEAEMMLCNFQVEVIRRPSASTWVFQNAHLERSQLPWKSSAAWDCQAEEARWRGCLERDAWPDPGWCSHPSVWVKSSRMFSLTKPSEDPRSLLTERPQVRTNELSPVNSWNTNLSHQ